MSGKLFVIGTPIGNLGDITLRAIETLKEVEVLYCEDSRVSSKLINHLLELNLISQKPVYVPYNEFNESYVWERLVGDVRSGKIVGLVSDAGMPTLSDPGYRAIRGCLDAGLEVNIVPGVTALTTALAKSGMGGELLMYVGFLPKTSGKAAKILDACRELMEKFPSTRLVFYVSPHRLLKDLIAIKESIGNLHCCLLRELTKQHEERIETTIEELMKKYENGSVKGELVLIVSKQ